MLLQRGKTRYDTQHTVGNRKVIWVVGAFGVVLLDAVSNTVRSATTMKNFLTEPGAHDGGEFPSNLCHTLAEALPLAVSIFGNSCQASLFHEQHVREV